jgi:hypothetical protein
MYDFQRHIAPLFLELRRIASEGAMQALIAVGLDHATRTPKPWTYYLGVGVGGAAIASGIPNASLIVYCAASALDLLIFKSPEGGLVDVFIDGIAATNFTTYAANAIWEAYQVNVGSPDQTVAVEFRTRTQDADGNPYAVNWFSVASFTPIGGTIQPRVTWNESPPWELTIALRDDRRRRSSFKLYIPYWAEAAEVERYLRELVERLQPVTGGRFVGATMSRALVANSLDPVYNAAFCGQASFTFRDAVQRDRTMTINVPMWSEVHTYYSGRNRVPRLSNVHVDSLLMLLSQPRSEDGGGFNLTLTDARGSMVPSVLTKARYRVRKRR